MAVSRSKRHLRREEAEQPAQPAPAKRSRKPRKPEPQADPAASDQPDVDLGIGGVGFLQTDDSDTGLVDTPEEKAGAQTRKPRSKPSRARKPKAASEDDRSSDGSANAAE